MTIVANEVMEDETMTETQKTGIVKLIPKKGDLRLLANWIPISLLCVDNKAIAKVIATRLKPLLNKMIVKEQTGGMQDRDVADNLSRFRNVIESHAEATGKLVKGKGGAAIVSLDFEKAFDRLDRTFLYELMKKQGFSKKLLDMIKTLYEGNISKIVTNGKAITDVKLGRGVRQGCPLAMYLYIIFINPLLERLRSCMVGVNVGGKTIK